MQKQIAIPPSEKGGLFPRLRYSNTSSRFDKESDLLGILKPLIERMRSKNPSAICAVSVFSRLLSFLILLSFPKSDIRVKTVREIRRAISAGISISNPTGKILAISETEVADNESGVDIILYYLVVLSDICPKNPLYFCEKELRDEYVKNVSFILLRLEKLQRNKSWLDRLEKIIEKQLAQ